MTTPGPWTATQGEQGQWRIESAAGGDSPNLVALVGGNVAFAPANARAIAALPALIAALQEIAAEYPSDEAPDFDESVVLSTEEAEEYGAASTAWEHAVAARIALALLEAP